MGRLPTLGDPPALHRLTRLVLRAPLPSALVLVALTAFWIAGLSGVRREFGYRTLLGPDYPPISTLEAFVERYGGGFPVYVVWECGEGQPCQSVFDESSLRMAHALEQELRAADGVRDVHSPASASLALGSPDGFAVRRFFENGALAPDASRLAPRARDDPLWVGNLISPDGAVGALVVLLEDTQSSTMERVVDAVEARLEAYRAQGFEFHLGGHPVASVVAGRDLAESTASLVPFTAIVIALVILVLTRSLQATLVTMLTMGIGLLWTFGFLGWLRWPQDSLLQVLAPLVLIVGVSDAVHVLSRYAAEIGEGRGRNEKTAAILAATREISTPCLITTITTAAAFLSFLTSDLVTFVRFGAVCAFGVCACLLLTFALLPLLVVWLPLRPTTPARIAETWRIVAEAILRTARQRSIPILAGAAVLGIAFSIGWIGYLRVDTDPEEMFGSRSRVTRWDRFIGAHLHGTDSLELNIGLPGEDPLASPETQAHLTRLAEFLRSAEGLGRVTSVQDLLGRLNRVLHDDDPAFERPGDSAAANAEILELLAMDDRETLEAWATLDGSELRVSVEGLADTSMTRGQVLQAVREYVDAELPASWSVALTGPFALSFDWVNALQRTQLRSFATAFLLVLVLMALYLRSVPLGLAAMVPALLPVVLTLGLMGFAGMSLDVGRVMIAAIVIGIAVDDSVHLLGRYRRERQAGRPPSEAVSASLLFVARPVVVTSVSLALGFLTLTTSAWQTISSFGFLVSLSILSALVATLFVLPALFFAIDSQKP